VKGNKNKMGFEETVIGRKGLEIFGHWVRMGGIRENV
jgi:hypothetical protein